eukprot:GEMP01023207.1.p4 GENE.GEMP01023207.1~~GEMP01023207.1.p4  ORF type:complete len:113 (+),score=32.26 GEMP01023207.1:522-860(+)
MGIKKIGDRKKLLQQRRELVCSDLGDTLRPMDSDAPLEKRELAVVSVTKVSPPGATSFFRRMLAKGTAFYGSIAFGWEFVLNVFAWHPLLHCVALFPMMMSSLEAVSWWYTI